MLLRFFIEIVKGSAIRMLYTKYDMSLWGKILENCREPRHRISYSM